MARRKEPNPDEEAISKTETTDAIGMEFAPVVQTAMRPVLCKPRKTNRKKFDEVKRAAYLRLLADEGYNKTKAGLAIGIDHTTVWRTMQADPAFAKAVSEAEMKGQRVVVDKVESALIQTALDGNVTAQKFALVNLSEGKYRDATSVEHRVSMDQMEKARRFAVLLGVSVENVLPEGTAKGAIVDIEAEEPD